MELDLVPLLKVQRELYAMPRSGERFQAYLRTMVDADTGDLALPLVTMNPMGKDHIPVLLDTLLAIDAEAIARNVIATTTLAVSDVDGRFAVGLVVADDAHGGWTDRYCSEYSHRFEGRAMYKRGWIVGQIWTGDPPSVDTVREETATAIHRLAHILRRGTATTLGEMIDQEGTAMAAAGCSGPTLDAEHIAYTRDVLAPSLDATDRATVIACLFGDEAAHRLGYRAHGLSPRAGLALALHDGRTRLDEAHRRDPA